MLDSIDQLRQSDEAFNLSWLVNSSCVPAVFIDEEGGTACKGSTRFDTYHYLQFITLSSPSPRVIEIFF